MIPESQAPIRGPLSRYGYFTYRSPPISSGISRIVFLLLLRWDIPSGTKNSEIAKCLVVVWLAKEQLQLRLEQVKVCSLDVSPLLSTVEMRAIRCYDGLI